MRTVAILSLALSMALPAHADPLIERGRRIAELNCAGCHAIGTDDASRHPEAPPFRELSRRYPVENLAEALAEGIYTGHPDMPAFEASPAQVEALLAHLKAIQAP